MTLKAATIFTLAILSNNPDGGNLLPVYPGDSRSEIQMKEPSHVHPSYYGLEILMKATFSCLPGLFSF
jgi:hypothetical protein